MSKKISLFNLCVTLVIISACSAFLIGSVYKLTEPAISKAKEKKQLEAIASVVGGDFDNDPYAERISVKLKDGTQMELFPARKDGQITSIAVKSSSDKGFGGKIEMMVGIFIDGTINNYEILEQHETPGLGTKISETRFKSQFKGYRPASNDFKLKKDGGDIDAVTAATISSRAAVDALSKAYKGYNRFNLGNKNE